MLVSYTRVATVKELVHKLRKDLEGVNLRVWPDEEDIPADIELPLTIRITYKALVTPRNT